LLDEIALDKMAVDKMASSLNNVAPMTSTICLKKESTVQHKQELITKMSGP